MVRDRAAGVDGTVVRLLLTSFVVSLATSGFVFAVPFYVLARLGRTDAVGTVVAIWTMGYIASCLLSQRIARRFGPRATVAAAAAGVGVFTLCFRFMSSVPQMAATGLLYGLSLGGVWAPLMGWLSGDAEGVGLSRRLGLFNLSWSISVILAPLLASYLVRQSITLPFGVMTAIMALAGLIVLTTPYRPQRSRQTACGPEPATDDPSPTSPTGGPVGRLQAPEPADLDVARPSAPRASAHEARPLDPIKMRYIRYLAWLGAAVAYMAVGVYRYQMPHLAKTIRMDEVVFGRVAMALSLAIMMAFFVLARWTGWHGRTRWVFLPQVLLITASGLLTWSSSAWTMVPIMLAAGFAAGFLYANSVFYGSLGAAPAERTRRMSIHEICLNCGVIAGSYLGNLLSQHLGPRHVYPYLAGTIGLLVILQAVGWRLLIGRHAREAVPIPTAAASGAGA